MKNYILILIAMVFLLSCGEDEEKPKLPPITTYGANTLGFEIDGNIWTPCCVDNSIFGVKKVYYVYYLKDNILNISAHNNEFFNENSNFKIKIAIEPTQYYLSKEIYFNFSIDSKYYYPLISENESIFDFIEILKYDYEEGIFSCKFSFDVYNKELDKIYKIRNGRVDAKFDKKR